MTTYHPHKLSLSEGQKKSLSDAFSGKTAVTLRLKHSDLSGGDTLHLTESQIKKMKRAASAKKGVDLTLTKTQIQRTARFAGKGLHVRKPGGGGLRINPPPYYRRPPPFIGTWENQGGNLGSLFSASFSKESSIFISNLSSAISALCLVAVE